MCPSFPTPQGPQSVRHPSKFPPRTVRIRGAIQVRLSFQIDGLLTSPSKLKDDTVADPSVVFDECFDSFLLNSGSNSWVNLNRRKRCWVQYGTQ